MRGVVKWRGCLQKMGLGYSRRVPARTPGPHPRTPRRRSATDTTGPGPHPPHPQASLGDGHDGPALGAYETGVLRPGGTRRIAAAGERCPGPGDRTRSREQVIEGVSGPGAEEIEDPPAYRCGFGADDVPRQLGDYRDAARDRVGAPRFTGVTDKLAASRSK